MLACPSCSPRLGCSILRCGKIEHPNGMLYPAISLRKISYFNRSVCVWCAKIESEIASRIIQCTSCIRSRMIWSG